MDAILAAILMAGEWSVKNSSSYRVELSTLLFIELY